GDHRLRTRAEDMHFVAGANWNERYAGTNAPGLALTVDHEVQIFAVEHFARGVHAWSCSAAPLHEPDTGRVLGFLDLTGTDHAASPAAMALVRAAASAADSEMRALHAAGRLPRPRPAVPDPRAGGRRTATADADLRDTVHLRVLGRQGAELRAGGRTRQLSLRHSEILHLLARHPEGLSGGDLGALLADRGASPVTVRAEVARLRRLLGEDLVASRPYRLCAAVHTDADRVRTLLADGALSEALRACTGHLLPASTAPGVVEDRAELQAELCSVLEAADDPEVLVEWAEHPAWREDPRAVAAAVAALDPGSPRCRALAGRLAWLGG
ncbi:helix-turn-helix domain-containing protein, partial [Nocardiopsis salina]|uniref:helix-turn-helix domain-containing protein n=1 Tax=Nocardiopsis salina TaxID=245836 RepID=UPI0003702B57